MKKLEIKWIIINFLAIELVLYFGVSNIAISMLIGLLICGGFSGIGKEYSINTLKYILAILLVLYNILDDPLILVIIILIIRILYLSLLSWIVKEYSGEKIDIKLVAICIINMLCFMIALLTKCGTVLSWLIIWIYNIYLFCYLVFVIKPMLKDKYN